MKPIRFFVAVTSAIFAVASLASGQTTVATDPVGYVSLSFPTATDTMVSVPLTRTPEFTGAVASVSGSTITVSGTTGWTASQFVYAQGTQSNHYYVLIGPNPVALAGTVSTTAASNVITGVGTTFTTSVNVGDVLIINNYSYYKVTAVTSDTSLTVSIATTASTTGASASVSVASTNPKEGNIYMVVANTTTSLTLDLNGDTISSLQAGTQVTVIPYWTLSTLFPASAAGTAFTSTTSIRSIQTQILIPDYKGAGINLAAPDIYFFYNGLWRYSRDANLLTTDYSDTILIPDGFLIVRNPTNTAAGTLAVQGNVLMKQVAVPVPTQISTQQDTPVAVLRPADVALNQIGLIESGAFVATTSIRSIMDQLLVYSPGVTGINKAADKIYFYYNGDWRLSSDPNLLTASHGSDVIPAGSGFIIRKAKTASGNTISWKNTPNFN